MYGKLQGLLWYISYEHLIWEMKMLKPLHTVYEVLLADIKLGELVCDVNWRVFSLVRRAIQVMYGYQMSVDSAYI